MKKYYDELKIKVSLFEQQDVITGSFLEEDKEEVPGDGDENDFGWGY